MNLPKIIQGGMGVAVSDWKLAKAVCTQGHMGVVSGTGIALIVVNRLMEGDAGGHVRRALNHFPIQEDAQQVLDTFYVPGGIPDDQPYKRMTMWTVNPPRKLNALTAIANFVEVFLAKEGHDNPVGINLLEKVQMPNLASLYGAMLAGVDFVIMGAGIPIQIAGVLDKHAEHQPTDYRLDVLDTDPDDDIRIHFDPEEVFPGIAEKVGPLKRPNFLPIVSSVVLAKALVKRSSGKIDGFVVEMPTAGGHNAPPRGVMQLDDNGEPIYGKKDEIRIDRIKDIGLPFWLAGGYGNAEGLQEALDAGAVGIQVGTAFAYCNESGMAAWLKKAIIRQVLDKSVNIRTDPLVSPTGFPFKVVQIEDTLAEKAVFEARSRICDIGFLRHIYKQEDGKLGYRCPAEPEDQYEQKGGDLEDTVGRTCLCCNLGATAGFAQRRNNGYIEPPSVTSGDALPSIGMFFKPGEITYSAKDVIDILVRSQNAEDAVAQPTFAFRSEKVSVPT